MVYKFTMLERKQNNGMVLQFDGGYRPTRLANWEVGRVHQERPRQRRGTTRVIADDRGHLLPGVARSQATPWGPLTQGLEPGLGEQRPSPTETRPAPRPAEDDQEEDPAGEGTELQVTGAGLLSAGRSEEGNSHQDKHDSNRSHGTVTPASFRKGTARSPSASQKSSRKSSASSNSSSIDGNRALKETANITHDTVEDALLPRRPEEDLTALTGSRALAIRLVDHPAPTNCTKYVVLRPNTAPSPAPSTKPPLLPKRPKTSKIIRKVPEIEFALKWDLKENDIMEEEEEEEEVIEMMDAKKKPREPPSPRSVSSVDSGIHIPKTAWGDGPDTRELASKLERLEVNGGKEAETRSPSRRASEPESGYGTPKSAGSLPSVASRASSGRGSIRVPLRVGSTTPASKDRSRTISMDSQRLAQGSTQGSARSTPKKGSSSTAERHTPKSSSRSSIKTQASRKEAKTTPASPQPRDPLAIMETKDSVFHTVPLRDTGRGVHTYRSTSVEPRQVAATTQTEELQQEVEEASSGAAAPPEMRHNHPGQVRSRNCLACEVRAMDQPPKKFQGPSDFKPAFRAGKMQQDSGVKKVRYTRQSEKYNARLRARHQPPRYWPINTLSSPFCNRPGYGQDQYPDHMRLRTTYGTVHATAPKQTRGPIVKKLYL
ncbi:nucleolar protein dao-5-like isoform X2 [Scylla paramamosain]|uniref:nucleolar protein dao-5-like isoform X2 n=1 Tax=Scylla paramamosain TaxID=85552 RepID=UPI00308384C4